MSAHAPAIYYAVMAALAVAASGAGLRVEALTDATNRALPYFRFTKAGEVETLSGEEVGDWLDRLRTDRPYYFHAPTKELDAKPAGLIHGKVGDGQAATRLAASNGGSA